MAGGANPYYYSGSGDGGPATSAALGNPTYDATVDGAGNLYIVAGRLIRKVTPDGKIATVAGGGTSVGDYVPATQAELFPLAIVADSAGDLFIADTAFGNSRIRMVDTKGIITTIAGGAPCCNLGDGGPATNAYLSLPYGLALDASGSLYVAQVNSQNNLIRKISGGTITTFAGGGQSPGDGGPATGASLSRPLGVAVDNAGNVYIAEANGNRVRKVSGGVIATVAGNGSTNSAGDGGPAIQAGINSPWHVAVDAAGDLFISQINDARVRLVTPGGNITTMAGTGTDGSSGDGGPGSSAMLDRPAGIALGNCSQVYVVDSSATIATVRVLNPVPFIVSGGVVPSGSSASAIESGSWVSIYGTNLAGCTASWNGDFPTTLGGTSVTLDSKPGYLWFVSPTQINVQVPDDTTTGLINVAVTTAGGNTSSTVTLAQYAPAFSLFSSKYPAAIVSNATGYDNIGPAGAFPFPSRPVQAGETVTLFGGGFGPTNPPVPSGKVFSGAAPCGTTPQVTIGGMPATVSFAGVVGAGLYQLNVIVPAAGSGDQPLQATVGGATTQSNIFLTLQ
jgi:uncharacterized protein (TIGR03437 family)